MEKQRQIQSILRYRANDPPGMDKGDPIKHFCYENIEALVVTEEMHDFEKIPMKFFAIENTDFNKLNFSVNKMMFLSSQYQIADKIDREELRRMKFRIHVVLGMRAKEIWSLIKIVRVLKISKDVLFEEIL